MNTTTQPRSTENTNTINPCIGNQTLPIPAVSKLKTTQPHAIKHNITALIPGRALSAETVSEQCQQCASRSICISADLMQSIPARYKNQLFRSHRISKGQHLFHAGDPMNSVYVVKSGLFKTYLDSEAGDEQVMGFQMPGEILGSDALARQQHSLSAVALESSTVCATPIKKLEAMANRFAPDWLLKRVYEEVLRERNILLITGRRYSADARVAYFLLELSARNKVRGFSDREFKLTMPQRDIARYLDMALETVSRVFTRLQDYGIVTIKRPYITIEKMEELRGMVDLSILPNKLID